MSRDNKQLLNSKKYPNDEFYTPIESVQDELKHYNFTNKVVYCNCDNPHKSNFFKYFKNNFDRLKLKGLISTFYGENPYKTEVFKRNGELLECRKPLKGDGSFYSEECIKILDSCDVVCTNPPFSLFREYINLLSKKNKDYIVIGSMLGAKYLQIFELIKKHRLYIGYTFPTKYITSKGEIKRVATSWFTTFETKKESLKLTEYYNKNEYPKYDNYDAIEVNSYKRIPKNYDGLMGVSAWFMNLYCKDQFNLIAVKNNVKLNGKSLFARIIIKRK